MIKFYFEKVSDVFCGNSRFFGILKTFISGLRLFYLTSKLNVTVGIFISSLATFYLQVSILGSGSRQRKNRI